MKRLASFLAGAALALATGTAFADYMLARRTPTGRQALNSAKVEVDRERDVRLITDTLVLKYFTPSNLAVMLGIPYVVERETPAGEASGVGDLSLTVLQVFEPMQGLALAPYARTTFPTGGYQSDRPVNAGSGRYTQSFGGALTFNHGALQIDALLEYAITMPNPNTGANPGDVVQGSLSAAYHPDGFWTGLEAVVRRSGDDEKLGERTAAGQTTIAVGPEARVSLGSGFLLHVGGKIGTHGTRAAEARVMYNF